MNAVTVFRPRIFYAQIDALRFAHHDTAAAEGKDVDVFYGSWPENLTAGLSGKAIFFDWERPGNPCS
jgi:hypothetical protein